MQLNFPSFLLLKKLAKQNQSSKDGAAKADVELTTRKTRKQRFADWMSPKPAPIPLYPGEVEIFRKGLVLVTDTRLAYIDPFDRMLKTYMFEHMISTHKQFYRTSDLNRRLCKGLMFFSLLVFLVILTIDLLDSNSSIFFLVYIPLLASIVIGIKVWNDMKPRYVVHWRMRDHTYEEIVQEPMLRERLVGSNKREVFMTDLANAMNQALSGKSWWPGGELASAKSQDTDEAENHRSPQEKPPLKLVTENYQ